MMNERDFLKIIEALCGTSIRLFTTTGTFYEVVAFLEGFALGADVGEVAYHSRTTPFRKWVVKKFNMPDVIIDWAEFRGLFSSDSEALEKLPILYKEYIESSAPQD